jgi:predicted glycosyltransferase
MLPLHKYTYQCLSSSKKEEVLTKVINPKERILKLSDILIEKVPALRVDAASTLVALRVVEAIKVEP